MSRLPRMGSNIALMFDREWPSTDEDEKPTYYTKCEEYGELYDVLRYNPKVPLGKGMLIWDSARPEDNPKS